MGVAAKEIENALVINQLGEVNWCGWGGNKQRSG